MEDLRSERLGALNKLDQHNKIDGDSHLTIREAGRLLLSEDRNERSEFFRRHAELSESTARSYRASWDDFLSWCESEGEIALPASPKGIGSYLKARARLSVGTLRNRISSIRLVHRKLEASDPTGREPASNIWKRLLDMKKAEESDQPSVESLSPSGYLPSEVLEGRSTLLGEYFQSVYGSEGQRRPSDEEKREEARRRQKAQQVWLDPAIEKDLASPERLTSDQKKLIPEPEYVLSVLRNRAILLLMATGDISRSEIPRLGVMDVFVEPAPGQTERIDEEEGDGQDISKSEGEIELEEYLTQGLSDEESVSGGNKTFSDRTGKPLIHLGIRKKSGMPDRLLRIEEGTSPRLCPSRSLVAWIVGAGLETGPLFRSFTAHGSLKASRISPPSVNLLLQEAAKQADLDPSDWTPSRLTEE